MMTHSRQRSSSALQNIQSHDYWQTSNTSPPPYSPLLVAEENDSAISDSSRSRANTGSDISATQSATYRPPIRSITNQSHVYMPGQGSGASTATMDTRNQYLPGPPPVLSPMPQNNMIPLPPPPPRPPPNQTSHSILPPPPPGPFPGPPPGPPGPLSSNWMGPGWNRMAVPPPPPPLKQMGLPYPHLGPPPISIPPRQNPYEHPQSESQPLTSATYIPGGDSFGPGVGIPGLHSSQPSGFVSSDYVVSREPAMGSDTGPYYHEAPHMGVEGVELSAFKDYAAQHDSLGDMRRDHTSTRSSEKREWSGAPLPLGGKNLTGSDSGNVRQSSLDHRIASTGGLGDSPNQWPLDRVISWLATNKFSVQWQETFKAMEIQGSMFLELGQAHGGRGNFGMMHNIVYPALAKECSKNGVGFDQAREREEGKRMRRLIRGITEGSGAEDTIPNHGRNSSAQLISSAGSENGLENSPKLNTPSTAGGGDESPVNLTHYHPTSAISNRSMASIRSGSHNSAKASASDGGIVEAGLQASRTGVTREILSGMNGPSKRHSPNVSADAYRDPSTRHVPDGSPRSSSPGLQAEGLFPNSIQTAYAARTDHQKTNSIDSTTSAPVTGRPSLWHDRRRGDSASQPLSLDVSSRQVSDGPPSGKEHSKGFLNKFRKRKKDDPAINHDEGSPDSPTSPQRLHQPGFSQQKSTLNNSDYSLDRLSSVSASVDERNRARGTKKPTVDKKFVLVTPDKSNFKLVDVTHVNDPVNFRELVCQSLGILDYETAQIYLTETGQIEHEETLTDAMLELCRRNRADDKGTLKFFVHHGSAPISATSAPLPSFSAPGFQDHRGKGMAPPANLKLGPSKLSTGQYSPGIALDSPTVDSVKAKLQATDSTGGIDVLSEADREASLEAAIREYRREIEKKQKVYQQARQARLRKESPTDSTFFSIKRDKIIDFDSPRESPFEDKKQEQLVPLRKPPPAPAESSTLTKANSLSKKPGDKSKRESSMKLRSAEESIAEEPIDWTRRKAIGQTPSVSAEVGTAASRVNGSSSLAEAQRQNDRNDTLIRQPRALKDIEFDKTSGSRGSSPGGSPRSPGFTYGKNNMLFKLPDYGEGKFDVSQDGAKTASPLKPQMPSNDSLRSISPGTDLAQGRKPSLRSRRSYSAALNPSENGAILKTAMRHDLDEVSDEDSDDGLFAKPLAKKASEKSLADLPTISTKQHMVGDDREQNNRSVAFSNNLSVNSTVPLLDTPDSEEGSFPIQSNAVEPDGIVSNVPLDSKIGRRKSLLMRDDIWANRPPMEALINDLDTYFPNIDLDQPVFEEQGESPPGSPSALLSGPGPSNASSSFSSTYSRVGSLGHELSYKARPLSIATQAIEEEPMESDTLGSDESTLKGPGTVKSAAQRNFRKSGGLGRMKSIREVARGANQGMRRQTTRTYTASKVGDLSRRKSTKMFGANIVQINPGRGSRMSLIEAVKQEPASTRRSNTYRVIRGQLIGKGTYGRVYVGINATNGEVLAIKQVEVNPKSAGQDKDKIKDMVASLDREIDTMQHLEHPNIVQYLGCERKEYSISIFLEYISGGSIGSCLRKHGKFEERVVSSLTRQVLSGLSYLHGQSILHRDLKADNILLDADGTCKISDFGISKRSDDIYGNDVTNSMQGSVFWMAPEVIRSNGKGYSAKVDIWSLGCVVLEMFAGRRPWGKEEAIGAIYKLGSLSQAPPIPDDVSSSITAEAVAFMWDCFTVNPGERPTADTLFEHHPFCKVDPYYNFLDTELHDKLREIKEFR